VTNEFADSVADGLDKSIATNWGLAHRNSAPVINFFTYFKEYIPIRYNFIMEYDANGRSI
jgi:hypothetical protein